MINAVDKQNRGANLKGYGWPVTLEMLRPLDTVATANRQGFKMILCPSRNSVHELGGNCHLSRHRHNRIPANSTTTSVQDFYDYYQNDETMLKDQFNPFIRESIPPLLLDASAESHITWGSCVLVPCVTAVAF